MAAKTRTITLTFALDEEFEWSEDNEMDISIDAEGFSGGFPEVLSFLKIATLTGVQVEEPV